MTKISTYLIFIVVLITAACRDYVEVAQPGKRVLKYTNDYQYVLNNAYEIENTFFYAELASDDIDLTGEESFQNSLNPIAGYAYTWAENIFGDTQDVDWRRLYDQIYTFNSVTEGVMSSQGGTDTQRKDILGQAKVHRAFAYFCLVNIYAKQYNAATADTDPGVPMLLKPDLFASLKRASVQAVYEQIIRDLTDALSLLPAEQTSPFIPSLKSVNAMLARVYLQMNDYDNALLYAGNTLALHDHLNNLADYAGGTVIYPTRYNDDEILLSKTLQFSTLDYPLSAELLTLLGEDDLRYQLFTATSDKFAWVTFSGRAYWKARLTTTSDCQVGPSVPEMMLIRAECLAREGEDAQAIGLLNDLRQKRFLEADYTDLPATGDALPEVLNERRREMFGTGMRLFDQKRLNLEPAFAKTIVREFKGETYTLEPNSNEYVFQIAPIYRAQNSEIEPNPR